MSSITNEYPKSLDYVSLQMDLLNEIERISKEEAPDVAFTIFQRVLRATQEFRRVYAEHDYGIPEPDETRIPLSRTKSEVSLRLGNVVQKPD